MSKFIDLTGQRFGRLTVIRKADQRGPDGGAVWECLCDCGNTCFVWKQKLTRKGHSAKRSCGCLQKERHKTYIHGDCLSLLYHKWADMKDRCLNPNAVHYSYYGGRGISICEEWKEYTTFRDWALSNGYQEGLSLDRIDANGNYEPNNCRWVTLDEQKRNKRNNIIIEMDGQRKTLAEWVRVYDLPYSIVWSRLKRGWNHEKALKTPIKSKPKS